jgi:hypothetical protein
LAGGLFRHEETRPSPSGVSSVSKGGSSLGTKDVGAGEIVGTPLGTDDRLGTEDVVGGGEMTG